MPQETVGGQIRPGERSRRGQQRTNIAPLPPSRAFESAARRQPRFRGQRRQLRIRYPRRPQNSMRVLKSCSGRRCRRGGRRHDPRAIRGVVIAPQLAGQSGLDETLRRSNAAPAALPKSGAPGMPPSGTQRSHRSIDFPRTIGPSREPQNPWITSAPFHSDGACQAWAATRSGSMACFP